MAQTYCDSTSTHYYTALQQFSKSIYIFVCAVNVIISVSSTLGNIMILSALRKCQSLHSPSKALLSCLALTDIIVGIAVVPLFTAYYLTIILEIPTYYCVIGVTYGRVAGLASAVSLGTITTIAIDRFLAVHLRLRYRQVVKFKRVVYVLVVEWIAAAFWTTSWLWSVKFSMICGTVGLLSSFLITFICYVSIYRSLSRHHDAKSRQQENSSESSDFNVPRCRRTVNNMVWIFGLLVACYIPYLSSLCAILITGLNSVTRFVLHFSAIAIYFNSCLNPIIYCWRIKELKEKVIADLSSLRNFFS